jgi:hypothetical protein
MLRLPGCEEIFEEKISGTARKNLNLLGGKIRTCSIRYLARLTDMFSSN